MTMNSLTTRLLPLCAAVALACVAPAHAASLNLTADITNPSGLLDVLTPIGGTTLLTSPVSSDFGNSHAKSPALLANGNYTFADFYVLDLTNLSVANGSAISFDLGTLNMDKLHANLYWGNVPTVNPGALTIISSIDFTISGTDIAVLLPAALVTPGFYTLEILGMVVGADGASYGGNLNVSPVPVPAAVWLLGSALTSVVATRRRKAA